MDELLAQFLIEARELIAQAGDDLIALSRDAGDRAHIDGAFRAIHTLKGSVAIFDMAPAGRALHAAEDVLERARAGTHALSAADLDALVAVVDQTDRWIDAMERDGTLGATADADAETLLVQLNQKARASSGVLAAPTPEDAPAWRDALLDRHAAIVGAAAGAVVAFRYAPDSECFFRGDDPLALVAAIPELVALDILPHAPWPALDRLDPFHCAVSIEGISAAPIANVRAALRFVADQVAFAIVPRTDDNEQASPIAAITSLRVDVARIDALADGVGELIVANTALSHIAAQADRVNPQLAAQIRHAHAALDRAVGGMRDAVTAVRMVSLRPSLRRLPRMVREIADALGKPIDFDIRGEGTEVDKGIADAVFEPLLHLVRNALDHGIESGDGRRAAGKPDRGSLQLIVRRDGDQVLIALKDDGAGIDPARIRHVAVSRGLLDRAAADALDDAQALRLIFAPGFSTAAAVSAVSGRGVGMDAVQTVINRLGGRVEIASVLGQGSEIRLRLPLNAIVTSLLIVEAAGQQYGVPLDRIVETTSVARDRIMPVGAGQACSWRDRTLPVLDLAMLLGGERSARAVPKMLVTEAATEPVGLIVDSFGQRIDALVRPRAGLMAALPGIAGTTLLADGGVLLVLDLAELIA
ncbi:chemotaxis protein CheA [Sphingomonas qilianensis]|uniref:histidine kinase n=1 Tax=Sphingomonas qilianensis TaxID=1736690 RepID=A0ABU9XUL9_9SPHN